MKRILLLSLFGLFACLQTWAQSKNYSGKVTAADDGSPLPGVTVQVKGTAKGTQTNGDGAYSIETSAGQTLVFSFVGFMPKEVKLGASTTVNVTLGVDENILSEVVVVGYTKS